MSWRRDSHGQIDDLDGDGPVPEFPYPAGPQRQKPPHDEHARCGYRPVVGGVSHLTWLATKPPIGTVVDLLCGKQYQLGRRRISTPIYDCSACDEVYREQMGLPPRHLPPR